MFEFDELKIYRGKDIQITPKIIITQPTLSQIEEFGERKYFNAIHTLTAVGADLKWQLWDLDQIDYTKIEDYDLFIKYISKAVSSNKKIYEELMANKDEYQDILNSMSQESIDEMLKNPLELILKDIDLADFDVYNNEENGRIILYKLVLNKFTRHNRHVVSRG
jgi:hypothetical protein